MKIGIDSRASNWYRGTGLGTYSYELINYLNKIDEKNNYILYCPDNCKFDFNFKPNFKTNYIDNKDNMNFWTDVSNPIYFPPNYLDIYHVPQNGIGLPNEKNCPLVITLHDIIPSRMPETVSDTYLKLFNEKMPEIISLCDGIITVSEYSKKDISKEFNYPEDKIFVTYLASEDIYKPLCTTTSKHIIENCYGICDDFILYIGGFSPRKNIIGLIEAFNILKNKHKSDIKLVIAGTKGKSYDIYKERVDTLHLNNEVLFPGFISMEHMPYLYNASKLFVYPSFYEGFGLPPIEAMSCGIPVVASNATSIPEILNNSALYINPYDIDDLYIKMYRALIDEDLRNNLIKNGFNLTSKLSWKKTAYKTLDTYSQIAKKGL